MCVCLYQKSVRLQSSATGILMPDQCHFHSLYSCSLFAPRGGGKELGGKDILYLGVKKSISFCQMFKFNILWFQSKKPIHKLYVWNNCLQTFEEIELQGVSYHIGISASFNAKIRSENMQISKLAKYIFFNVSITRFRNKCLDFFFNLHFFF